MNRYLHGAWLLNSPATLLIVFLFWFVGVFKESFAKFTVDAKLIDPVGRGVVKAVVVDPLKQRTACIIQNQGDGTYKCSYSPLLDGKLQIHSYTE